MTDYVFNTIKDIKINQNDENSIENLPYVQSDISTHRYRIYYQLSKEKSCGRETGFNFVCVEWFAQSVDPYPVVEVLMRGNCSFEGIRHIWFGEEGYMCSPLLEVIADAIKELIKLESKFCDEKDLKWKTHLGDL